MKNIRYATVELALWAALLCIVGVMGCGENPLTGASTDGPVKVFVNIPPQKYVAEKVGGEHADVSVLVDAGENPHSFTPTPQKIMALGRADLYFRGAMPFEQRLVEKLQDAQLNIVDLNASIDMLRLGEARDAEEQHGQDVHESSHPENPDPHVWLSPKALKQQARNIADALKEEDPDHENDYEKNLNSFLDEIETVDQRLKSSLAPYQGRTFYVFHPAFSYFARAYDLHQRAVQVEGKDPSPKQLRELIQQAQKEDVRIIFVQPQFRSRSARAIADAINGAVVPLDPLKENVLDNLSRIAEETENAFDNN